LDVAVKSLRLFMTVLTNGVFDAPPVIHGCSSASAAVRRFAVSLVNRRLIKSFAFSLQGMSAGKWAGQAKQRGEGGWENRDSQSNAVSDMQEAGSGWHLVL
jgi:hypothetical protein